MTYNPVAVLRESIDLINTTLGDFDRAASNSQYEHDLAVDHLAGIFRPNAAWVWEALDLPVVTDKEGRQHKILTEGHKQDAPTVRSAVALSNPANRAAGAVELTELVWEGDVPRTNGWGSPREGHKASALVADKLVRALRGWLDGLTASAARVDDGRRAKQLLTELTEVLARLT